MVIMALDHVRDYFHAGSFLGDPTDLATTTVPFFFTRWITHYCAPIFVFLSGTSAWMVHQRKGARETALFLLKRGLWLIAVEVLVIRTGWTFNPTLPRLGLQVIWAIGVSMVVLSALIHLPWRAILGIGLLLVCGHNALDSVHFGGAWWWKMLHEQSRVEAGGLTVFFAYPLLPWIGTMALGYCFGRLYGTAYTPEVRGRMLAALGITLVLLFIGVRWSNLYGDPEPWSQQRNGIFTVISFLNVTKYPPSLLYLLMTLGPAMLFLAWSENLHGRLVRALVVFGRVPFFYYLLHIPLIHSLAMGVSLVRTGGVAPWLFANHPMNPGPMPDGYRWSLSLLYVVWATAVAILFVLCRRYAEFKSGRRDWWLSYL